MESLDVALVVKHNLIISVSLTILVQNAEMGKLMVQKSVIMGINRVVLNAKLFKVTNVH